MKKAKFFESFGLKILAVFISIMLWLVVINVSDPVSSNTYSGVALQAVNADAITSQGKVYEIIGDKEVTISVNAKRSVLDSLSNDNFKAIVDLSEYSDETGTVPVRVESNKYSDSIESMKSKTETVEIAVEDMLRKQFVITPVVTGEPLDGYVIGDVTTAENIVRISGAQSVVSAIKKVTAEVNVSGLSSSINTSVDLKLYDESDELIRDVNLTKNISTVAISAQLLETKIVELTAAGYTGTPAEGYCISGEPQLAATTVLVAGRSKQLSTLTSLEIPAYAVNVDGIKENKEVEVELSRYLPDGIIIPESEEQHVLVTVPVEQRQSKILEIDKQTISIKNLPDGYRGEITAGSTVMIEVNGSAADLEALTESDVKVSVDWEQYARKEEVDKIRESVYRIPLTVTFSREDTISLARDVTVGVKITQDK